MTAFSYALGALGLTSTYLISKKYWYAWVLLTGMQPVFIGYYIVTRQYGIIPLNLVNTVIGIRAWRQWKKDSEADSP